MNNYKEFELKSLGHICHIIIGNWQENLRRFTNNHQVIYLTDRNVFEHYKYFLSDQKTIIIEPGEKSKTLERLTLIYRKMLELKADRSSMIVGFGGGVVTDIAGFIASTFMRGIKFGFVSTSLLGQVDAVIGGKNGVNLDGYKNMIGTFNQPAFIINDPSFFKTLPEKEFTNGMAEVIKQFLIADQDGLLWFNKEIEAVFNQEPKILLELIYRQSRIKSNVVERDEKETGIRKILNFGHTFGHAIEKELGWPHGHAVAAGMGIAIKLSVLESYISNQDGNQFLEMIERCGLPTSTPENSMKFFDTIRTDKKRRGDSVDFILLNKPGNAIIHRYGFDELTKKIEKLNL